MTELQNKIVALLKQDARYTHEQIAVMLNADKKVIANEITALEKNGVIVKYAAILNEELINSNSVEALIEVKVSPAAHKGFDAIAEKLYSFSEVKSLYLMSGVYDLAVLITGNSLREVASFVSDKLSGIDQVQSIATHFILKKYKTEGIVLHSSSSNKRLSIQA